MSYTAFPGNNLRQRRESLGVSIYEAYRNTRVPVKYIELMERGDVASLPGECYSVGFLRTYCQFLELEPDPYVDTLRACSRPAPVRFPRSRAELERGAPWMQDLMTWAVIMAVILLGWVTYAVVFRPQGEVMDKRVAAGVVNDTAPDTDSASEH
ncbi:MAG: helix-turn-helix domain-containing protein [Candidatus Hydrogenedentes bacterium]|nr:helix-turn-helix domain-containing protein [Candidatus Hydrogenedentota bacterium]